MNKQMILVQLSQDFFVYFFNWVFCHEGLSQIHDKDESDSSIL